MLKKREWIILLMGMLTGLLLYHIASPLVFPSVVAVFSPDEGDEIIAFIDSARETLDIEMYVFSSEDMIDALKRAHDRGVTVRVILERRTLSDRNEETMEELLIYGIQARWASEEYKLTHAKFAIVDGTRVLVGSHNWSDSALHKNREASVILGGNAVEEFKRVFAQDWELAE